MQATSLLLHLLPEGLHTGDQHTVGRLSTSRQIPGVDGIGPDQCASEARSNSARLRESGFSAVLFEPTSAPRKAGASESVIEPRLPHATSPGRGRATESTTTSPRGGRCGVNVGFEDTSRPRKSSVGWASIRRPCSPSIAAGRASIKPSNADMSSRHVTIQPSPCGSLFISSGSPSASLTATISPAKGAKIGMPVTVRP